jgi:hypothetical protein
MKGSRAAQCSCVPFRHELYCAVRYGDGVALSLPFLGVSSLNFGPLSSGLFSCRETTGQPYPRNSEKVVAVRLLP